MENNGGQNILIDTLNLFWVTGTGTSMLGILPGTNSHPFVVHNDIATQSEHF